MKKKKILVIDDEDLVIKSVQRILSRSGFDVIICRNGEEAMAEIKKEDIDLIVCDIRMPGISGIETITEIRRILKNNKKQTIPEILITGYADDELTKAAEALNVAEYIYKPFDLKAFLNCIKDNLSKK